MKRKYALAHLTALACPPPELIYYAGEAGYDYVGLRPILMHVPGEANHDFAHNRALFRATKEALKNTGVQLNDIEVVRVYDGVNVREEYEAAMEAGAELGAKYAITSVWSADPSYYTEKFSEICALAAQYQLKVNLEFVTWSNIKNMQEAVSLLQKVNYSNTTILVDSLHFYRSRDTLEEIRALSPRYFPYFHFCDAPKEIPAANEALIRTGREERLFVGEGAIDVKAIADCVPEALIALEIPNLQRIKELGVSEYIKQCLTHCKQYLED